MVGWWNAMRKHGQDEVFRITGARQGLADDVRARQRRYVISMLVRTAAVIAAATLWNVERHVAIVALVLGAVLPYVAVVVANAGRESAPAAPESFIVTPTPVQPMLEAPQARAEGRAEPAAEQGRERTEDPEQAPRQARQYEQR
ncbi:DUF3099 domain-containing protein [Streptomyces sp. NPDC006368]|uniref:DUF3099 domain-containing protein n=1 Tax=Streptomyces sp. NPDC006368 TaxID=3156760 RepID=UPI0033AF765D